MGMSEVLQGIVGDSAAIRALASRIHRTGPYYRTALITGPTGSGKELAARALHELSPARTGKLVSLNCSAVVDTLFESELFGHVRGAFTGADRDKTGLFEHADGGTLFLDEIGDMPSGMQAKLLRVLQSQEILRVGSVIPRRVDVRFIAATHRNLQEAIAARQFREDLYYRLAMIEIRVPSLAERRDDLPLLIDHMIRKYSAEFGRAIRGITPGARAKLMRHEWPGNVRELENAIGHACMMAGSDILDTADLPNYLHAAQTLVMPAHASEHEESTLVHHEKNLLTRVLYQVRGNQTKAAKILGIGRDALRYRVRKHGLGRQGPHHDRPAGGAQPTAA